MTPTLESLNASFETRLALWAHFQDTFGGPGAFERAHGLPLEAAHDTPEALRTLPIYQALLQGLHYGFEGLPVADAHALACDLADFVDLTNSSHGNALAADTDDACAQTVGAVMGRWKLDSDEADLTLREIALLGGLEEAYVRNAASRKDGDQLTTVKDGHRTLVEPAVARDWLSRRKGFRPTTAPVDVGSGSDRRDGARAEIRVTQANIEHGHLYLGSIIDLFPADALGGASKESAGRPLDIIVAPAGVVTCDIAGDKKIFRDRAWARAFFNAHAVKAGDTVVVQKVGPRQFHVFPAVAPSTGA